MDLGFMELMRTAAVIIDESLKPQPGEDIVIVSDSRVHEYQGMQPLTQALMAAFAERGFDPTMIVYEGRQRSNPNIPNAAAKAIESADIVVAENSVLILQSQVFERLMRNRNNRVILLPSGINVSWSPDEIYRMMPRTKEELTEMSDLMNKVGNKLEGNHKIHFSAPNGTDAYVSIIHFPMYGDKGIAIHDGKCDKKGTMAIIPGGSIVCMTGAGSITGKIVLDAEASFASGLLHDAATLYFQDGLITSIEGDGETARLVRDTLNAPENKDMQGNAMPEYGMGFNKRAQLNGNTSEGESLYGCVHIGIGAMRGHFDAILPNATVEVDGELVLKDGEYL